MSQEVEPSGECRMPELPKQLLEYSRSPAELLEGHMQELTRDHSTYESRVSFDTFDNKDATDISFTLVSKHKDYAYTRRSRTFLCGTDRR